MLLPGASLSVSAAEAVPVTQTIEASAVTGTAEGAVGAAGTGAGETTTTVTNRTTTSETANIGNSSNSTNSTNTVNDTNTVNETGSTDENNASSIAGAGNNSFTGNNSVTGYNSVTGNNSGNVNSDAGNNNGTSNASNVTGSETIGSSRTGSSTNNTSGNGAVTNRTGSTSTNRTSGSSVTNRGGSSASSYDNNSSGSASGSSASTRQSGSGTTSRTAGSTSGRTANSSSGSTSSVLRDWDFVPGVYDVDNNRVTITTTELTKEEIVKRLPQYVRNNATDTEIRIQSYVNRAYKEGKEGTYVFTAKLPSGYRVTSGSLKIRVKTVEGTEHPDYPEKLEDSASDGNAVEVTDEDSADNSGEAVSASDSRGSTSGESAKDSADSADKKDSNTSKDSSAAEGNIFQRIIRRVTSLFTGEEENADSESADSSDASGNGNSKDSAETENSAADSASGTDAGGSAADESKEGGEGSSRASGSNDSGDSSGSSSVSANNGFASGTANGSSAGSSSTKKDSAQTGFSSSASGAPRRVPKSNDTVKATDLQDAEKLDSAETDESGEGTSITDETGKNEAAAGNGAASVSADQNADGKDASGKETSGTPDNSNTALTSRNASGETSADAGNAESVSGSDAGTDSDGKIVSSGTGSDGKDSGSEDGKKQDADSGKAADKDGKDSKDSDATDNSKDKSASDSDKDSEGEAADTGTTKKPVYKWNVGDVIDFFNGKTPMEETSGTESTEEGTTASDEAGKDSTEESSDKDSTEAAESSTEADTAAAEASTEAAAEASTEETDETAEKPSLLSRIKSAFAKLGGPRKAPAVTTTIATKTQLDISPKQGETSAFEQKSGDSTSYYVKKDDITLVLDQDQKESASKFTTLEIAVDSGDFEVPDLAAKGSFTIDDNSGSYKKDILISLPDSAKSEDGIKDYISKIKFTPSGTTQNITFRLSSNEYDFTTFRQFFGDTNGTIVRRAGKGGTHYYVYIKGEVAWHEAYTNAKKFKFDGLKGYLLTADDSMDREAISILSEKAGNTGYSWTAGTRVLADTDTKFNDPDAITTTYTYKVANNAPANYYWADGQETGADLTSDSIAISSADTNTNTSLSANTDNSLFSSTDSNVNKLSCVVVDSTGRSYEAIPEGNYTVTAGSRSQGYFVEFSGYDKGYLENQTNHDNRQAQKTVTLTANAWKITYDFGTGNNVSVLTDFSKDTNVTLSDDKTKLTVSGVPNDTTLDTYSVTKFTDWTLDPSTDTGTTKAGTTADATAISSPDHMLLYFYDQDDTTKSPVDLTTPVTKNTTLVAEWVDMTRIKPVLTFNILNQGINGGYFDKAIVPQTGAEEVIDLQPNSEVAETITTADGKTVSYTFDLNLLKDIKTSDLNQGHNSDAYKKVCQDILTRVNKYSKIGSVLDVKDPKSPTDDKRYEFVNWSNNLANAAAVMDRELPQRSATYSANYQLSGTVYQYTVTFTNGLDDDSINLNNASPQGLTKSSTNYTVVEVHPASSDKYAFQGWYIIDGNTNSEQWTKSFITPQDFEDRKITTLNLIAKWGNRDYSVTFDIDDDTTLDTGYDNPYPLSTTGQTFVLPKAEKPGYTFDGWYFNPSLTKPTGTTLDPSKYNEDFTLYPKFSPTAFTITYHHVTEAPWNGTNNDGNVTSIGTDYPYESFKLYDPTAAGYTFDGWWRVYNEEADVYGTKVTVIKPKEEIDKGTTNIDLYAKWVEGTSADEDPYHINYVLNGGEFNLSGWQNNQLVQANGGTVDLHSAKKNGYDLVGWYLTPELDGTDQVLNGISLGEKVADRLSPEEIWNYIKNAQPTNVDKRTLTLYAKYPDEADNAGKFKIIYHPGKGTIPGYEEPYEETFDYAQEETIKLPKPERAGYTFRGWHEYMEDEILTRVSPAEMQAEGVKELNLYASWGSGELDIVYHLDGGENSKLNPETVWQDDSRFQLSPATKEGYKFDGWYTEPEFETQVTVIDPSTLTGPLELFAKFEGDDASTAASSGSSASDANGTRRMAANGGATISAQNGILPAVTGNTITGTGIRTVSTGDEGNIYAWGTSFLLAAGSLVVWLLTHNIPLADAGPAEPRRRKVRAQTGGEDSGKSLRDLMER